MIDHARRAILAEDIGDDFVAELTDSFWADSRPLLEAISAAAGAGDLAGMRRALHTIAGSAGNVGLTGIAAAAEAAGAAIKAGDTPDIKRLTIAMTDTRTLIEARKAA